MWCVCESGPALGNCALELERESQVRESVQGENPVPGSERILDLVSHTFALPNGIDRDNGILLSILSISITGILLVPAGCLSSIDTQCRVLS